MKLNCLSRVLLALMIILPCVSDAAQVADEERTPLDLRRTTLIVTDMDKPPAFYRDALGMAYEVRDRLVLYAG